MNAAAVPLRVLVEALALAKEVSDLPYRTKISHELQLRAADVVGRLGYHVDTIQSAVKVEVGT